MKIKTLAGAIILVTATMSLSACSGSKDSTDSSSTAKRSYAGSGSNWRWTLNADGTFTGIESESSSTLTGTYTTTSTGFIKATVATTTGGVAPAVGTVLAGIEIQGFALLWKPILSTESEIVGTIKTGTCPTADFSANFLYIQYATATDMTDTSNKENFGTITYTVSNGVTTVDSKYCVANSYAAVNVGNSTVPGGTCSGGVVSTAAYDAYLTTGAGIIKVTDNTSPSYQDAIFMAPKSTVTNVSNLAGNYSGYVYNQQDTPKVHPLTGTISGSTITLASVSPTDLVTADNAISGTATITAVDSPSTGFVKATVGGAPLICVASLNVLGSGKTTIVCSGQTASDHTKPYLLVLSSY